MSGRLAKGRIEHFRGETASPHAQQHHVCHTGGAHLVAQLHKPRERVLHVVGHAQPAQAIGDLLLLVGIGLPERGVLGPDLPRERFGVRTIERGVHRRLQRTQARALASRQVSGLRARAADLRRKLANLLVRARDQLEVRVGERLHALHLQLLRHRRHVDPDGRQAIERGVGFGDARFEGQPRFAVLLERDNRLWRHGVDGFWSDQLLDIDDVAVGGILGAGARPEAALCLRAGRLEGREARPVKDLQVFLVGQPGVRDRGGPQQGADLFLPRCL